ncbi:MAG: hypothetical protein IJN42_08295, partial [Clostridia bacterium]|nr:hypothetical protein [Clostridia bacterium]
GMLAVCYLPSRRKDGKETNPIRSGFRSLPGLSQKIFIGMFILLILVGLGAYLGQNIPKWQENKEYEKSVGAGVLSKLSYASTVNGEIASVAAGNDTTYLITDEGTLYAWGYNNLSLHQQDKGAVATDVVGVAQLDRDVYLLKKDHALYKIDETGAQTKFADNVAKVSCGAAFGSLLTTSGDVYVWGDNSYLQLGAAGADAEKPLWLCGAAADVSAGGRHLLVLKKDGSVYGCGSNMGGALGVKDKAENLTLQAVATEIKAIAAGSDFSLILTKNGVLKSSGANDCGQLGREENEDAPKVFDEVTTGVSAMGVGSKFGWYISEEKLYTWGQNHCGQLGTGNTANVTVPAKIMDKATTAAAGADHLAIVSNGKLFVCGDNSYGQLGSLGEKHLVPATTVSIK